MTFVITGLLLLAEEPNKGPDYGKASPVGLLVVVLLLIAVFVLVWSMNRHLKRIPESFDDPVLTTETSPDSEVPPRESAG